MYFHGLFNLKDWDNHADYMILDDIDEKTMAGNYKQWFGAEEEVVVTDKYQPKRTLKWGKPMIWLSNSNPLESGVFNRKWMEGNTVVVHLEHQLWGDETQ